MSIYAFETLSVTGTASSLTQATADDSSRATITVEVAPVRFRLDGTAPTALVGHLLDVGDMLVLHSNDEIEKAKFISVDGVTASLSVTYEVL